MGIYVLKSQDRSEDIGIVLEGQKVLRGLDNFALATAMLFGLMYALNLNYPPEMKCTSEDSHGAGRLHVIRESSSSQKQTL